MGEICIHFKEILVVPLQPPLESIDVSRAQSKLLFTLDQEDKWPVVVLLFPDDVSCAVRGTVINDQDMELAFQCHHGINHATYVLPFFVGGYDDQLIRQNV